MSLALIHQLFVNGAWTTYPGLPEDGWEINIGPDVESGLRANTLSASLNNDDLSLDPSNVTSPLYGQIGRNTRTRMRLNGITLTWAEASSWQPDATTEHVPGAGRGKAWVDMQAEGLLRRLGRWTDDLRSAMTRQASSYSGITGYWTGEDDSGAAQLSNEVNGGQAGTYAGTVSLAGDPGAGGADGAIKMGLDGSIRGNCLTPSGNGYQISWVAKLPAIPGSGTYLPMFSWTDAQRRVWAWSVNNIAHQISITDPDGSTLIGSISFLHSGFGPDRWCRYRVKVTVSGGTVQYEPALVLQDAVTSGGVTAFFASTTAGRPTKWVAAGNAYTDGAAYGHVLVLTDTAVSLLTGQAANSFDGYLGELAVTRYQRLTTEEGITGYYLGSGTMITPMGRQKPGTFLELITECVVAEGGLLYDEPTSISLMFASYQYLLNRTPVLALTKSQLAGQLRKTIDDVGVINDVTLKNWDGSTTRATLDAGALSTAVPPAGIGRVKATIDISMSRTDRLASRANWELRKGTLDRPRYLSVTVDLLANPGLADTVTGMRPGEWISLAGVEPDIVYLRVISINRRGNAVQDTVRFNCLPAELYQVGVYGSAGSRYDSASTTLAAAIATTAQTALSLTTASYNDRWSSTAVPYDIKIGGERMTVTAMTAGAGTGPVTQTATVIRAVNGVTKTHSAGAEVHLFAPVRYALG